MVSTFKGLCSPHDLSHPSTKCQALNNCPARALIVVAPQHACKCSLTFADCAVDIVHLATDAGRPCKLIRKFAGNSTANSTQTIKSFTWKCKYNSSSAELQYFLTVQLNHVWAGAPPWNIACGPRPNSKPHLHLRCCCADGAHIMWAVHDAWALHNYLCDVAEWRLWFRHYYKWPTGHLHRLINHYGHDLQLQGCRGTSRLQGLCR